MKIDINNLSNTTFFSSINQIAAFSLYLKVPYNNIKQCIMYGGAINSPLRNDNIPSFSFYISGDKIKARDFAGYFWGDIIDLVALIKGIEVNKNTINLIKEDILKSLENETVTNDITFINKETKEIFYTVRKWNNLDKVYWDNFGLPLDYLIQEYVYPVKSAFYDNKLIYEYSNTDLCYAYYLGNYKKQSIIKLYFPLRAKRNYKKPKFITNGNLIQGLPTLNQSKFLIVSKANKDRLIIKYQALKYNLDLTAIALPSENHVLLKREYNALSKYNFKHIFSILDPDTIGIRTMKRMKELYNIQPLHIKQWSDYRNLTNYKDIGELISKLNLQRRKNLINLMIKELLNYETEIYKQHTMPF